MDWSDRQPYMKSFKRITTTGIVVVMLLFFVSCKEKKTNLLDFKYDPETTPTMITDSVNTLISDSGITRYKLTSDVWRVFDKASEPYWHFPKGIYLQRFDENFNIEATVKADTAWHYSAKKLWRLKGHVIVENILGERFLSDELFWDQLSARVYSDKYIEIKKGETELKGYGFESNQEMTEYRIFRPHDGLIPFNEDIAPMDSVEETPPVAPAQKTDIVRK